MSAPAPRGLQQQLDRVAVEIKDDIKELAETVRPMALTVAQLEVQFKGLEARTAGLETSHAQTRALVERIIRLEERITAIMGWGGNLKWIVAILTGPAVAIAIKLIWG